MIRHRAVALFAAVVLCGCGTTELHEVVFRTAPPTRAACMPIYGAEQSLPRPADDMALLEVIATGNAMSRAHVEKTLAERAAQLGCDAVARESVQQGATVMHAYGVCVHWSPAGYASAR